MKIASNEVKVLGHAQTKFRRTKVKLKTNEHVCFPRRMRNGQ